MQITAKFLADLLTGARALVAIGVLGAARWREQTTIPPVVGAVTLAWSSDMLDGQLAKKGGKSPIEWVGKWDHAIDSSLASATLIYLWRVRLIPDWLLIVPPLSTILIWLKVRSEWVWMSFNTGSHVVALTALFNRFPTLASAAVGWGALVTLLGRHRAREMLAEIRLRLKPSRG
ncbi:MAG: hypothetical protein M3220_11770 [Chloroflexota bacterium]|nr:hypothetical protein [Chloroflexota bacterium]